MNTSERLDELYNEFMASDKSKKSWDLTVGLRIEQLLQRIREEVIGEDAFENEGWNTEAREQNKLRQAQREILETMERDV